MSPLQVGGNKQSRSYGSMSEHRANRKHLLKSFIIFPDSKSMIAKTPIRRRLFGRFACEGEELLSDRYEEQTEKENFTLEWSDNYPAHTRPILCILFSSMRKLHTFSLLAGHMPKFLSTHSFYGYIQVGNNLTSGTRISQFSDYT